MTRKKNRDANSERINSVSKAWRSANPEHMKGYRKIYYTKKKKDIGFRLNMSVAGGIGRSIRGNKNGKHWEDLIGYTLSDLKKHLEKQFMGSIVWENYGEWHIDHKIPISAFNFTKPEHADFKRCWALSNLQPMWASENLSKGNKLKEAFQPSLAI